MDRENIVTYFMHEGGFILQGNLILYERVLTFPRLSIQESMRSKTELLIFENQFV